MGIGVEAHSIRNPMPGCNGTVAQEIPADVSPQPTVDVLTCVSDVQRLNAHVVYHPFALCSDYGFHDIGRGSLG